ncbi:putative Nucleolysin TIA-1 [Hypsibius exemplaris]|uniref:Nucleolysin TIA-1 n=1 Tax=Hypsibius exemplaris TaxID=2072580 RepID=A0A1W0XF84_HYPEX|nr:putative Nucleolysin TIA-1 [Hypsibius exemplaris]
MGDSYLCRTNSTDDQVSLGTAPHQVFVGDLPSYLTEDNLRDHFSPYGPIVDCRVIRDPMTQKSKCFGFVRFARNEDAEVAIAKTSESDIDGKRIRTNWAFKRGPNQPLSREQVLSQASHYITTVYIGGLGCNFNAEFVRAMCAMYGPILEIRLFQEKGYAFVRYASRESAAAAILGIHNSEISGHLVRCSWGKETRDPHVIKMARTLETCQAANGALFPGHIPSQSWPFMMAPSAAHPAATQIAANIGNYHISFPYSTPFYNSF